ncbi:hypothetical protein [Limnohabitans sp.]
MTDLELNEALLDAVADHDLAAVKQCLQDGADILYVRTLDEDYGAVQPITVLSMVLFRWSDNRLEEPDFLAFTEITAYLLAHGADTRQAIALAAQNYGLHDVSLADADDVGMPPWRLIAKAHAQRDPDPS